LGGVVEFSLIHRHAGDIDKLPSATIEFGGLRAHTGKFVISDGAGTIITGELSPRSCWSVVESPSGYYYIRDFKGRFLCATDTGAVSTQLQRGDWAEWQFEVDQIRNAHGEYLTCSSGIIPTNYFSSFSMV
jgi:hypothetical protein